MFNICLKHVRVRVFDKHVRVRAEWRVVLLREQRRVALVAQHAALLPRRSPVALAMAKAERYRIATRHERLCSRPKRQTGSSNSSSNDFYMI